MRRAPPEWGWWGACGTAPWPPAALTCERHDRAALTTRHVPMHPQQPQSLSPCQMRSVMGFLGPGVRISHSRCRCPVRLVIPHPHNRALTSNCTCRNAPRCRCRCQHAMQAGGCAECEATPGTAR